MSKVISKYGPQIAYKEQSRGPALILVDGAIGYEGLGFSNMLQAEALALVLVEFFCF